MTPVVAFSAILAYIRDRMSKDKNLLIAIVGEPGSGKSYVAMALALALDPNFDISRVVFFAKDFVKKLREPAFKNQKGACIVWEEVGVEFKNIDFHKPLNNAISDIFQTNRCRNKITIMTTPYSSFIDKKGRLLINMIIEPVEIDYENEITWCTVHVHDTNARLGKTYQKRIKWEDASGGFNDYGEFSFRKPSDKFLKKYTPKKLNFVEWVEERAEQTIDMLATKERKTLGFKAYLDVALSMDEELLKRKGKFNTYRIANALKCSINMASRIRNDLELSTHT